MGIFWDVHKYMIIYVYVYVYVYVYNIIQYNINHKSI